MSLYNCLKKKKAVEHLRRKTATIKADIPTNGREGLLNSSDTVFCFGLVCFPHILNRKKEGYMSWGDYNGSEFLLQK